MKRRVWFVKMAAALLSVIALAPRSQTAPEEVIFINGINNTLEDALENAEGLREALNGTATRNETAKRMFRVWLQYNEAGWTLPLERVPGVALLRDVGELAVLKVAEECYLNRLLTLSHPYNRPIPIDHAAATEIAAHLNSMIPETATAGQCGQNALVSDGIVTAARMSPIKNVALSLATNIKQLRRVVLVAHSEGNILANLAYASIAASSGGDVSRTVRIVNVANTSAISMHGLDATHTKDGALALLATLGTYLSRSTVECALPGGCPFPLAPATLRASNQLLVFPTLGHSFSGTYLSNTDTEIVGSSPFSFTAGASEFTDRVVDYVYAATSALDSANGITVSEVSCSTPVVGQLMYCVLLGSNLPTDVSVVASNCNPTPMTIVDLANSTRREFSCAPQVVGQTVAVAYTVPGYVGALPASPSAVALAPPLPIPNATQPLNDTGSTTCFGASEFTLVACTSVDAVSTNNKQDGMLGRDVTAPQANDGAVGFSFELVPNGGGGTFAKTDCIRDRVTGLIWEGKPTSGQRGVNLTYQFTVVTVQPQDAQAYIQLVNAIALCGFTDWRLPTREELHGIVHYGAAANNPFIELDWFPNTPGAYYRTSTVTFGSFTWGIDFATGEIRDVSPFDAYRVRLVR